MESKTQQIVRFLALAFLVVGGIVWLLYLAANPDPLPPILPKAQRAWGRV